MVSVAITTFSSFFKKLSVIQNIKEFITTGIIIITIISSKFGNLSIGFNNKSPINRNGLLNTTIIPIKQNLVKRIIPSHSHI
mmetsp:Transcript_30916/g.30557  ORF Transcript_30916/g.30557 Transcript_30916/m.30557 type:complete len:82 (+) Transcript_30916:86-331(+)